MTGWRALGAFWAILLLTGVGGAAALNGLGAPNSAGSSAALASSVFVPDAAAPAAPSPAVTPPPASLSAVTRSDSRPVPRPDTIAAPDPALLEPSPAGADLMRPRIAVDGRTSMTTYAHAIDPLDKRPRVALLVVGFGLSTAESSVAMTALPSAITLGFSPYSQHPEALLKEARAQGHEYVVTLPMESQGYPLNQSGARALLTGSDPAVNDANLQWVLSRLQGEVGLTGASDGLRGERFASAAVPFGVVLSELAARGLLYVDPRVGAHISIPPHGSVVGATLIIDDPPTRADIDAKLSALEQQARDNGSAVGVAGPLRPTTVERIAVWARGLDGRGLNLVPVSAMVKQRDPA